MLVLRYLLDRSPRRCCDPATIFTTIGTSFLSAILADQSSGDTSANIDKQLNAQKEENQKNRDWSAAQAEMARIYNTSEAMKNRQFNAQQADLTRDFNAEEAQKQRDFELQMWQANNEYNSPVAQFQRLVDAGINPQVAMSGGTASVASSMPSGSPQASASPAQSGAPASIGLPSMPAGLSPVGGFKAMADFMQMDSLGSLIKALSSSQLDQANKQSVLSKLGKELQLMTADIENKDIQNKILGFEKDMKSASLKYKEEHALYDWLLKVGEYQVTQKDLDLKDLQKINIICDNTLKDIQAWSIDANTKMQLTWGVRDIQSQIARNYAAAKADQALALLQGAIKDKTESERKGIDLDNLFKGLGLPDALVKSLRASKFYENYVNHPDDLTASAFMEHLRTELFATFNPLSYIGK